MTEFAQWPKSKAGEAPWCNCPEGQCAGWDEAVNHGCCCRKAKQELSLRVEELVALMNQHNKDRDVT